MTTPPPTPDSPAPRDEDFVARALGALEAGERARVDERLARDPRARARFETIAAHLLAYDQLPPAPPPPPFARIEDAIDAGEGETDLTVLALQEPPRPARRRPWRAVAVAAALLVGVLVWRPWAEAPETPLSIVPGEGLVLLRAGNRAPAPARSRVPVAPGDRLRAERPAELRLADRVRVVLDAGASLRLEGPDAVRLEAGRAWFEVEPGAFRVDTAQGPVEVLGTAFEVDVRDGGLAVGVAHGRVRAGGHEIPAGRRLAAGAVEADAGRAGAWFQRPRLRLEAGPTRVGEPLRLVVVLENPHGVGIQAPAPSDARQPLWLYVADAEGRTVGELPVLPGHLVAGRGFLRPGEATRLAPGARETATVEIPAPFASPGTYLCRALYRPAGRPGVLSDALRIEVR